MPKRKKLTDADVKKVESVILSDTDVEKADRSKYGVARRSIWYILRFVLIASVVVTLCYAALMEAMYVSNIYIIVTEGMEMRADCILGNKSKAELTEHFTESWLQEDEAVNGNKYSLYRVDSYDHRLEIEKFRVWPWSWSVGRRISPVRDWLRRRWGITVGWRACSSRGWNLMGSCRWPVRMARMCWGSWPGCVHAGRSRRCGTPRRTCARCSDGSGGMTWRTRSAWPAYAGPTRSRERCPTTSTAACWRRAPRGRCRRGTRRSPCCR